MAGRKPKPTALKKLEGNPGKRKLNRNGYLYVLGYDNHGVYKINIANPTDITFLSFGFTSEVKSICTSGSCEVSLMMIGDVIIGYDFIIDVSDRVDQTIGGTRMSNNLATPLFRYKEFLVGWGGSYGNEYRYNFLFTPYLATICNLSQAVVKNADKTMKIPDMLQAAEIRDEGEDTLPCG